METIGGRTPVCGQQSTAASAEDRLGYSKDMNLSPFILWKFSTIEKPLPAEPVILPGNFL